MLEKLREMRETANFTQQEMARRLAISKQFYSQLERGQRRLTYEMALAIASIFQTTPDSIFLPNEYTFCRPYPQTDSTTSRDSA